MKLTYQEIKHGNSLSKSAKLWFLGGSSFSIKFHDQPTIFLDLDAATFDPQLPASDGTPALNLRRSVYPVFDYSEINEETVYLSTHEHRDHCDEISAIWILEKGGIFIGPKSSCERANTWGKFHEKIVELHGSEFQSTKIGGVTIHSAPNNDPNASSSNSYVLSFDGTNIFHNGDSLYDSEIYHEVANRFTIDIAIINLGQNPVGRKWYHSPSEVVKAAIDLKSKILVPHHYDKWDIILEDPDKVELLAESLYPFIHESTRFVVLKQGELLQYPY